MQGYVKEITGKRVLLEGYFDCIVYLRTFLVNNHTEKYIVAELSTGAACGGGDSEDEAIKDAESNVKKAGKRKVNRLQAEIYKKHRELNVGRF